MKIYIYIDESGSIHKNGNTKYFAVGGYFTYQEDKVKIVRAYKKTNLKIKGIRNMELEDELKARNMSVDEKISLLKKVQDIDSFCGCVKVFDKSTMIKEIVESNIFFNYSVKVLIFDCVLPILGDIIYEDNIEFVVSIDNRNIGVGMLKDLERYLMTEFCIYNLKVTVTYYDSATNYGVQLADLIVNTFYMQSKDLSIVKDVIATLKSKNFRISKFPGNKTQGRITVVTADKKSEKDAVAI